MAKPGAYDFYCEEALSGKTKIEVLYESVNVLAFVHTKPAYEIHYVVVPKRHIHDLTEITEENLPLLQEVLVVCRDLVKNINYEAKGGKILTNLGKFQDTPHLHFHVIAGNKLILPKTSQVKNERND